MGDPMTRNILRKVEGAKKLAIREGNIVTGTAHLISKLSLKSLLLKNVHVSDKEIYGLEKTLKSLK